MGFVDAHCHGGGGASFGGTAADVVRALDAHAAHGADRIVASLVTATLDELEAQLRRLRDVAEADPRLVGAHLEGPWLAPERRGAHAPALLRHPTGPDVARLIDAAGGLLAQVTIAPELPGAIDAINQLADAGVVAAVGHTEATAEQAAVAFDAGARLVTHAFNAMRPIGGREPGPLGAALADTRVFIEVIADGIHVSPANLRWLFAAAPDRVVLVTDAMAAAAGAEGAYRLGDLDVTVADGRAVLTGNDTLAGSTLTLDRAVDTVVAAGVPRDVAVAAATTTPARLLGLA